MGLEKLEIEERVFVEQQLKYGVLQMWGVCFMIAVWGIFAIAEDVLITRGKHILLIAIASIVYIFVVQFRLKKALSIINKLTSGENK